MPLYFIEQLVSAFLLFPLLSGNHCVTLLQMVTAKSQAQFFWPPPKGRLRNCCRLGTRLARRPLQPAWAGGSAETARTGGPRSPLEPAREPAETLLLFLPALLNDSGFDETPQEAPSLKKTEIWGPQASFEGGVSVPASANRKADGCQLNLGLRRWLSAALGGGSLPHLVP